MDLKIHFSAEVEGGRERSEQEQQENSPRLWDLSLDEKTAVGTLEHAETEMERHVERETEEFVESGLWQPQRLRLADAATM